MTPEPDDDLPTFELPTLDTGESELQTTVPFEVDGQTVVTAGAGAAARGEAGSALGPYPVVGRLGQGGMGEVLELRDVALERHVAAKVLLHESPESAARFALEARLTGRLEHPNVMPVHALSRTADGRRFFTMKRVDGRDLQALLDAARKAPSSAPALVERLEIFIKICDAIAFAHESGVIHRDLKPANVMVGEFGEVLVVDWGLAKPLSAADSPTTSSVDLRDVGQTLDGTIKGTPAYMSPEQARGDTKAIGICSDVYALGAVLYSLLTYLPPVTGRNLTTVLERVEAGNFSPPSRRAPQRDVPFELEAVILRAMSLRPRERFADVASLADEIRRFLRGEALVSVHYGSGQRLLRWCRRQRRVLAAAAAILGCLAVVAGGLRWREQQRHAAAVTAAIEALGPVARLPEEITALRAELERGETSAGRPQQAALERYQRAARRIDGALRLAPEQAELLELRRVASEAVVLAALRTGSHVLAAVVLDDLGQADELRALVRRSSQASAKRRRAEVMAVLDGPAGNLDRRVMRILVRRDHATLAPLTEALDTLTGRVREGGIAWRDRAESDRARVICRALGHIGLPGAVAPLGRWSAAIRDGRQLVEVGSALCNTRSEEAMRPLLELRASIGGHSRSWRVIVKGLARIPAPEYAEPKTAEGLLMRATVRAMRGRHAQAIADYDRVLAQDPDHHVALGGRAISRKHIGEFHGAISDFTRALEVLRTRRPNRAAEVSTLISRGAAFSIQREYERALADFDAAIALDPNKREGHLNRGVVLRLSQRYAEAIAAYNRTIELGPSPKAYYGRGYCRYFLHHDDKGALSDMIKALSLDPQLVVAWIERGRIHANNGKYDRALKCFNRAITLRPNSSRAHALRGMVRESLKDVSGAMSDVNRAIALGDRRLGRATRGLLYYQRKLYAKAIVDLDIAIGQGYRYTRIYYVRARLYDADDRRARLAAIRVLDKGIAVGKSTRGEYLALCHYLRGVLLTREGKRAAALKDLNASLAIRTRNTALEARGKLHQSARRYDAALKDFRLLTTRLPEHPVAWRRLADVLRDMKRWREAIRAYDRSIELKPTSASAHSNRGVCRKATGDLKGARADYEKAIALDPKRWVAMVNLGRLLSQTGDQRGAAAMLQRALKYAPKSKKPMIQRTLDKVRAIKPEK